MHEVIIIGCFILGHIMWYVLYGLECYMNGGSKSPYYYYFLQDLTFILPGGWRRKLNYCKGDIDLAKSLPSIFGFLFTHIFIPLIPLFVYVGYLKWIR